MIISIEEVFLCFMYAIKNNKYGVVDTDDAICEYYTKKDLISISKSINIYGVSNSCKLSNQI